MLSIFDSEYMPHQTACMAAVQSEFAKGNPLISFQLCTGSGKTRVIIRLPSLLQTKRNVFVFPTLSLIDQFKEAYLSKFSFLIPKWKEVCTNGITDQELQDELAKDEFYLVTTYISLPRILEYASQIDSLIFDEAHHVDGPICDESVKLHLHKITTQIRASATLNESEKPCYTYSFSDAVRDGRCRDYGIYCFIRKAGAENELIDYLLRHAVDTGNARVMAFTRWSTADRDDGTQSVNRFYERYRDAVVKSGGWMKKILGSTSQRERDSILKEFDQQPDGVLSILVSCKTISEGVDTRNANVAYFVDTDSNNVSIIQRIGRATRPYRDASGAILDDQRPGSVIVGMFISPEKYESKTKEEVDAVLKQEMSADGDFGPIFRVLAALRQTDEEMYERCIHYPHFDRLATKAESDGYDLLPGFDQELSEVLGREVETEGKSLEEIAEENGVCIVEHSDGLEFEFGEGKEEVHVLSDGDDRYLMASKKERYPDAIEKKRKRKKALMLDVDPEFRMIFRLDEKTDLTEDMIAKIEVEIEHDGKTLEERAIERARELVSWVKVDGKTPSTTAKEPVERKLGKWLSDMKTAKKGKGKGKLYPSVDEILISALGEGWWEKEDLEANAIETARQFVSWVKVNEKTPSASAKDPIERKLGKWLSDMKTAKKGKGKGKLYPSVDEILISALGEGWWEKDANAIETAHQFVSWVKVNEKTPSQNAKDPVERKLGQWLNNMKTAKKGKGKGKLYPSVDEILIRVLGENWHISPIVSDSISDITSSQPIQESHSSICLVDPCTCRMSSIHPKPMVYTIPQQDQVASIATSSAQPRLLPPLSQLHKEYKTLHSSNLHARFQSDKEEWRQYHRISEQNELGFGEEVPYKKVIRYIESQYKKRKARTIADLGCGMARVAKALAHRDDLTFINIDHVACDESVREGDIAHTEIEEGEVDLVILCLAMWGSNCAEYIQEAHRILDIQGRLLVIEPSKRWDHGARLRALLLQHHFVIIGEETALPDGSVHKFCMFVASKR